ncbi:hypothetical protein K439DRAFT_1184725 [Ramaria rubella]|nr:hypothetical protein K439DRAFT_1184725 [Ramaria rubella]
MNDITHTEAILFPADGRTPHLVQLMSSSVATPDPVTGRMVTRRIPHPQVHMNYIATNTPHRVWDHRVIANISYARNFQYPYVVFFPIVSQNGGSFPTNLTIRDIQGRGFRESYAWKGDIVVAKYWDQPFGTIMDCAMSDYPMIKNWFMLHSPSDV